MSSLILAAIEGILLLVVIVLVAIALWKITTLETIDTDTATLTLVATASGASLSQPTTTSLVFVTPGNSVLLTVAGFSTSLIGVASAIQSNSAIDQDAWPNSTINLPIFYTNNSTSAIGLAQVTSSGVLQLAAGPLLTDLFAVGTITIPSFTISWTQTEN